MPYAPFTMPHRWAKRNKAKGLIQSLSKPIQHSKFYILHLKKSAPLTPIFIQTEKSYIATLPRLVFEGPTIVVVGKAEAERAVAHLETCRILGIDTETRPAFKKGQSHPVALLQIATHDVCFLFRLNRIGMPPCLLRLLANAEITKVGLSLKDDLQALRRRADFTPAGFVELQTLAREMGTEDMSLQKLCANLLGRRLSKTARLSNWEADCLTVAQQQYAATDAYACLLLHSRIKTLTAEGNYQLTECPADKPERAEV